MIKAFHTKQQATGFDTADYVEIYGLVLYTMSDI